MEVASGEYGEEKVAKLISSIHNGKCEEIARRNAKLGEGSRTPSPPATPNNNSQGNGVIPTTPQDCDPEKQSLLECEKFTNGKVLHSNGSLKHRKEVSGTVTPSPAQKSVLNINNTLYKLDICYQ